MANDLRELTDPKTTAIVINEMQEAIAGRLAKAPLDALAKVVRERKVVEHLAALAQGCPPGGSAHLSWRVRNAA